MFQKGTLRHVEFKCFNYISWYLQNSFLETEDIDESTFESTNIPEDADLFFQDLSVFRVLGPKVVSKCLYTICPPILKNGIICNIDYSMTFLEFYEVLICCALLLVARTKKKKDFLKHISDKVRPMEDTEDMEVELRKSSGKLKKKKWIIVDVLYFVRYL